MLFCFWRRKEDDAIFFCFELHHGFMSFTFVKILNKAETLQLAPTIGEESNLKRGYFPNKKERNKYKISQLTCGLTRVEKGMVGK
jgi:hypothetical protein